MKEFLKLIAPYATTIFAAVGVYSNFQARTCVFEYRIDKIEIEQSSLNKDVGIIKDLLYAIDSKLNVQSAIIEERTAKKSK